MPEEYYSVCTAFCVFPPAAKLLHPKEHYTLSNCRHGPPRLKTWTFRTLDLSTLYPIVADAIVENRIFWHVKHIMVNVLEIEIFVPPTSLLSHLIVNRDESSIFHAHTHLIQSYISSLHSYRVSSDCEDIKSVRVL